MTPVLATPDALQVIAPGWLTFPRPQSGRVAQSRGGGQIMRSAWFILCRKQDGTFFLKVFSPLHPGHKAWHSFLQANRANNGKEKSTTQEVCFRRRRRKYGQNELEFFVAGCKTGYNFDSRACCDLKRRCYLRCCTREISESGVLQLKISHNFRIIFDHGKWHNLTTPCPIG